MEYIKQFVVPGGWRVQTWDSSESGLPQSAFEKAVTTLLIGIADPLRGTCNMAWLNGEGEWCFLAGLQYNQDGSLEASDAEVTCGDVKFLYRSVKLSIQKGSKSKKKKKTSETVVLEGSITRHPFVEGNTGTFTADARPVGDDGNGAG